MDRSRDCSLRCKLSMKGQRSPSVVEASPPLAVGKRRASDCAPLAVMRTQGTVTKVARTFAASPRQTGRKSHQAHHMPGRL